MEIVGLGVTVVDLLAVVERYPEVDSKQDVTESRTQVGGPVPTALTQLTRFGHRCQLHSVWGNDPLGKLIEADLRRSGIAFAGPCRHPDIATGYSHVWVERTTGRRTSITHRPLAEHFPGIPHGDELFPTTKILHLDGWPKAAAFSAAMQVKAAGGRVFLDTGSPKPGIAELLPFVDVVNAPRRFVEELLGEIDLIRGAEALSKLGPQMVTVTDGERGAILRVNGETYVQPALSGGPVIDTNGAGDVFSAGVIHGVICEWPPDQILKFAVAAAGLKCRSLGNRDALPTCEDVETALASPISSKKSAPDEKS